MSDFRRARGIQAAFGMSPYIWYPNPIIPDIAKAIGPERRPRRNGRVVEGGGLETLVGDVR